MGHVLADGTEGETPLIPDALMLASKRASSDEHDPVLASAETVFKLCELQIQLLEAHAEVWPVASFWTSPTVGLPTGWQAGVETYRLKSTRC